MTEEEIKELEFIKQYITDGTYCILSKSMWDKFAQELSNYGNKILKRIEETRNKARKIEISLFTTQRKLGAFTLSFDEVAKEFDLLFDSAMKWLRCIVDGNKYEEYQILYKKHVEELVKHCREAMDYLGSIISSKRDDYRFYRSLVWSMIAVAIALISLIFGIRSILR